ncbi:hypothetical protein EV182_002646, partial [Spiromyces aspiralis]
MLGLMGNIYIHKHKLQWKRAEFKLTVISQKLETEMANRSKREEKLAAAGYPREELDFALREH